MIEVRCLNHRWMRFDVWAIDDWGSIFEPSMIESRCFLNIDVFRKTPIIDVLRKKHFFSTILLTLMFYWYSTFIVIFNHIYFFYKFNTYCRLILNTNSHCQFLHWTILSYSKVILNEINYFNPLTRSKQ